MLTCATTICKKNIRGEERYHWVHDGRGDREERGLRFGAGAASAAAESLQQIPNARHHVRPLGNARQVRPPRNAGHLLCMHTTPVTGLHLCPDATLHSISFNALNNLMTSMQAEMNGSSERHDTKTRHCVLHADL